MRSNVSSLFLLASAVALWSCGCQARRVSTPAERLESAGKDAARLLEQMGLAESALRYHQALVFADSLVQIAPELPEGYFRRGLVLLKLYEREPADKAFARTAELDPYHRGAWYQRGHVAFEEGHYREAVRRYLRQRDIIVSSPQGLKEYYQATDRDALPQIWLQVGRAYQFLHRPDSAKWAYQMALDLDSTHAQANAWLSDLYDEEGETDRALKLAWRAFMSERRNPKFASKVGTLLFKTGSPDQALPILEWTATVQPWNASAQYNLGRVLIALGRTEEGKSHLDLTEELQDLDRKIGQARAAAARFPNDPARWRAVAELLGRAGRRDEQRETLSVARAVATRARPEAVDSGDSSNTGS